MSGMNYKELLKFYHNKRVLVTGHTGFKGSWLTKILLKAGAEVIGYSLASPTDPSLFNLISLEKNPHFIQVTGDIRNLELLKRTVAETKPEILFHLAAQPIVRDSYRDPVDTYSINVMGTVNVCECVRLSAVPKSGGGLNEIGSGWNGIKSFLNVTTDKVYKNNEWEWGYRENEPLDGFDPYSNSKSCSELVTHSYKESFFPEKGGTNNIGISTARAGNVIGGGDFANDRIIPDCVRALFYALIDEKESEKAIITVRNPYSIRPYQHVLEPLFAYLMIAAGQYNDEKLSGYYNVGPDDCNCITTGKLVEKFCNKWNEFMFTKECESDFGFLPKITWENKVEKNAPHEAGCLKLDCSKLKYTFDWKPSWSIEKMIEETVIFTRILLICKKKNDYSMIDREMNREIEEFVNTHKPSIVQL